MRPLFPQPAIPADAPAIAQLVNSAYRGDSSRRGWTTEADLLGGQRTDAEMLRETIETPGQVILIFHDKDTLVASVFLARRGDSAYLGMLTVRPDLQGAGLGKQILALAERWAAEHWSANRIEMTVITKRVELLAWYFRRGYHDTGRREPFPAQEPRLGLPMFSGLEMAVLERDLVPYPFPQRALL